MASSKLPPARRLVFVACLLLAAGISLIVWWRTGVPASMAIDRVGDAPSEPSAEALLRGASAARMRYKTIHAEMTIDEQSPQPRHLELIADIADGGRRCRFEQLPSEDSVDADGVVAILDDEELRVFYRSKHSDVSIHDRAGDIGRFSHLLYDPRLLGLVDGYAADGAPKDYLWYEGAKSLQVLGKEDHAVTVLWRVQAILESTISTFWIEPSTFRVYKRTIASEGGQIEILSYFDGVDQTCPIPSRVLVVTAKTQEDVTQATFALTSLRLDEEIPADRFSLASLDIPLNTAVNDDRIFRRIGYWNGQGVQEEPTPIERPSMEMVLAPFYDKAPPELSITDARGVSKDVKLADFRGKWVLLDFWCTSCGPCVDDLSKLARFYEEHTADRDRFEILAIASEGDAIRTMSDFDRLAAPIVAKHWGGKPLPFPVLLDADEKTFSAYGIREFCCLLIDPEGNLVKDGDQALLAEKLK